MVVPIARGLLTSAIAAHLAPLLLDDSIYLGRGVAPQEGGWSTGQPGMSDFVGYAVLKTGRATLLETDPVGRSRLSWKCSYQLTSSGGNEAHCDDVADRVRVAMAAVPTSFELREVDWVLQKIDFVELGSTVSSTAVDPPFWNVTDAVSLWLSRSRTSE